MIESLWVWWKLVDCSNNEDVYVKKNNKFLVFLINDVIYVSGSWNYVLNWCLIVFLLFGLISYFVSIKLK